VLGQRAISVSGHAKGHYLAFLDSDDLWFPWTLQTYRNVIEECCAPSFIVGKPYLFSDERDLMRVLCSVIRTETFLDYFASGKEWRWWGASSFVVRRDAVAAVGGFTEERGINGEDGDFALRLGVAPGFVQITAPATFGYREHAENVSKDMMRTVSDAWVKVRAEQAGNYPGGTARANERWRILTRHIRPVTVGCLRKGLRNEAWRLYSASLFWIYLPVEIKYLMTFPLLAAISHFGIRDSAPVEHPRA